MARSSRATLMDLALQWRPDLSKYYPCAAPAPHGRGGPKPARPILAPNSKGRLISPCNPLTGRKITLGTRPELSLVIPVFNELESLDLLMGRLRPVLAEIGPAEIIFVDDGSQDGSSQKLDDIHHQHPELVKILHFRSNFGKSNALQAGFNAARGRLVAMMDADLQDPPEELPNLLECMRSHNLDAVTGWKIERQDSLSKVIQSRVFNRTVSRLGGLSIHDLNCGLKVMKRQCVEDVVLFGQLHRFLLLFIASHGFKVGETPITHHPRAFGKSKYGNERIYQGLMDLIAVLYLTRFAQSPLYFFGFWGLACLAFALLFGGFFISLHIISLIKHLPNYALSEHPIWILSPITGLLGFIFIFIGLLAEMFYFSMQPRDKAAIISRRLGFGDPDPEA